MHGYGYAFNLLKSESLYKTKKNIYILGVLRYTGIDDNHDIQSNNYRYRVNLVCDDIPVLAITAIFEMNRTLKAKVYFTLYAYARDSIQCA